MGNQVRQKRLTEILASHGECSIEQLARELGVSDMTIRRDLQALSQNGKIIRTHGGAAMAERVSFEFEFLEKVQQNREAKEAIAKLAVTKVDDGQSVLLDSGTTTLALAGELQTKQRLTVITTSLPIASRLQFCRQIEVLLLGGYVRASSPDLAGALTESNLETVCADVAFIGAQGIDRNGVVYQQSPEIGRMLAQMVRSANKVYVVADNSKFDKTALCKFVNLKDLAGVITDRGIDPSVVAALKSGGIRVLKA
jgi:DeoR family fructose operon transcriptional repressor